MNYIEWINTGADYNTGLMLYGKLPKHNKNLLRLLLIKQNKPNHKKLKYELKKLANSIPANTIKTEGVKDADNQYETGDKLPPAKTTENTDSKYYRLLRLNQLPVNLHPLYIKQKNDFYKACSLKIELNNLPPEDESTALQLCIKIDRLFTSIEKSWQIFDHYLEFKTVPEIEKPKSYENLTPAELLKFEKSKREAISKAKARIKIWTSKREDCNEKQKILKLDRQIQKKHEDMLSHELSLEQIKELIHRK